MTTNASIVPLTGNSDDAICRVLIVEDNVDAAKALAIALNTMVTWLRRREMAPKLWSLPLNIVRTSCSSISVCRAWTGFKSRSNCDNRCGKCSSLR